MEEMPVCAVWTGVSMTIVCPAEVFTVAALEPVKRTVPEVKAAFEAEIAARPVTEAARP
jgi:hypothetical protein